MGGYLLSTKHANIMTAILLAIPALPSPESRLVGGDKEVPPATRTYSLLREALCESHGGAREYVPCGRSTRTGLA